MKADLLRLMKLTLVVLAKILKVTPIDAKIGTRDLEGALYKLWQLS